MKLVIQRIVQRRMSATSFLGGLGAGTAAAYLLDPQRGRRRRARIRDQATHVARSSGDLLRRAAVDLQNRALGATWSARSRIAGEHGPPPDEVLEARVRSHMGRFVSHPGAIEVSADEGRVTLSGDVFRSQAGPLLRHLRRIAGVREVVDQLERHDSAEHVSALQGPGTVQYRPTLLREVWPPGLRVLAMVGGGALSGWGLRRRGMLRMAATAAGAALFARGATNLPFRRITGIGAGRRAVDIQKDIHIAAPVDEVFPFFQNFENFPRFMSHIRTVRVKDGQSHWELKGPAGTVVRWDAELTRFEQNKLIAWRSTPGSTVQSAGIIRFDPEHEGTRLEIHMSYNPPAGAIGHAVARLFGTDAQRVLDDDLLRLKTLLEKGKATAHGETVTREELQPPIE